MNYNFDEEIMREGTDCLKYDKREFFFGKADVLPLWVADMDFRSPDFVIRALRERLDHEILGYSFRPDDYAEAIKNWLFRRHGWTIDPSWLSFSPGVVAGLTLAVETFSQKGDEVIIQPPVYFPFFDSVRKTGRTLIENPLKIENGRYTFDLEDLKKKITPATKMLLLSNPHNPGGTVWTRDELKALTDCCLANDIFIVADEIHSDLVFREHRHIPLPTISEEVARHCVVCSAPSKTFNLAGLTTSFLVIPDRENLEKYEATLHTPHLHMGNLFGNIALKVAYNQGDEWLSQLLDYLQENYNFLESFFQEHLPQVVPMKPEATYLVWVDFSAFGLSDKQLNQQIIDAGVGLNQGIQFGKQGSGYMRINIGCTRATLRKALECIVKAFQ